MIHHLSAGDHPCGATPLPTSSPDFYTFDNLANGDSGIPAPPYGGYTGADFWISFVMPGSGSLYYMMEPGTMLNPALALYAGPCNDPLLMYNVVDNNCDGSAAPVMELNNLIPGQTYYIRIWAENGSGNGSFEVFLSQTLPTAPVFLAFEDASIMGDCIELTPEANGQHGCAWYQDAIDFTQPFTHTMTANFGDKDATGADGICLVYQSNGPSFCGSVGGGIGAEGMPNSVIFEFDTWQNGQYADPSQDHSSMNINGDMNHANSIAGPVTLGNIEDGLNHTIEFSWDPAGNMYQLYFDGALLYSGSYDIVNNCFGGMTSAYWGYTSATGAANNHHIICPLVPTFDFGMQDYEEVVICAGDNYQGFTSPGFYASFFPDPDGCLNQMNTLLEVAETSLTMGGPYLIDCNFPASQLSATIASNLVIDNVNYTWSGPGGIGTDPLFVVDQPGFYSLSVVVEYGSLQCVLNDVVEVVADTISPQIDGLMDVTISCDPNNNISEFDAGGSSGSFLSFQWLYNGSFLSTNSAVDIIGEGTYSLEIIDGLNGCSAQQEVEVTSSTDIPTVSVIGDTLNCQKKNIELDATISDNVTSIEWTYNGDPFSTIEDPIVEEAGVYTISVMTDDGCVGQAAIDVIIDTIVPGLLLEDGIILCDNDSTVVSFAVDSSLYDIALLNGMMSALQDSNYFTVFNEGNYLVEAINPINQCKVLDSFNIVNLGSSPTLSLSTDVLNCAVNSVEIDLQSDLSDLTYQWTMNSMFVSDEESPIVISAGTYVVLAETTTGCSATDSITVIEEVSYPEIILSGEIIDCDNPLSEVQADVNNADQISWMGPNGFTGNNDTFVTSDPGIYVISAINTQNFCETIDSIEIISEANVPVFSLANDTINCNQDNVDINFNISTTYQSIQWTGPNGFISSQENPNVDEGGWYQLHIEVEGSCDVDTSLLIVEDFAMPNFTITHDSVTCNRPWAEVYVSNLVQEPQEIIVTLPDGSISPTEWPDVWTGGQYIITFIRKNGCALSDTIFIESFLDQPEAMLTLDHDLTCLDTIASISAISMDPTVEYFWEGPNGQSSTSPDWEIMDEGTYDLTIVDQYGCSNMYSQEVVAHTELPTIQVFGNDITCLTYVATLSVTSSDEIASVQWTGPDNFMGNQEEEIVFTEGWYDVEIMNDFGCANQDSIYINVIQSQPQVALQSEDTILVDLTQFNQGLDIEVDSDLDFEIEWIPGTALSCTDCAHPRFITKGDEEYRAIITDINGCTDTILVAVRYKEVVSVYIPNIFSPENNDNINEGFTLFSDENVAIINEMLVYDRWGELVYSNHDFLPNDPLLGWNGEHQGQDVVGGVYVYFFRVTSIYDEEYIFVGDVTVLH